MSKAENEKADNGAQWLPSREIQEKYFVLPEINGKDKELHKIFLLPREYYILPFQNKKYLVVKPENEREKINPGEILGLYRNHIEAYPNRHWISFQSLDIKTYRKVFLDYFVNLKLNQAV